MQSGSQRLIRQKALSVSSKLSMSEVVRGALAQVGGALSWMGGSVRIPQQVWSVIRDTRHGHGHSRYKAWACTHCQSIHGGLGYDVQHGLNGLHGLHWLHWLHGLRALHGLYGLHGQHGQHGT